MDVICHKLGLVPHSIVCLNTVILNSSTIGQGIFILSNSPQSRAQIRWAASWSVQIGMGLGFAWLGYRRVLCVVMQIYSHLGFHTDGFPSI